MKKRYIIIGLLASSLSMFGQRTTPLYSKKKLLQTDVQLLFSYYTQGNDHSAVTGGIGTEDLQVYASQFSVDSGNDSTTTYHFDAGVDVISSASTDNIDFVISSASKTDARSHFSVGFNNRIKGTGSTYGVNGGLSLESDYYSRTAGVSFQHINPSQSQEFSVSLQAFFDDLRWGRLSGKTRKLIYPQELRNKQWFTTYNRNSFTLSVGFYRTINQRISLGIYPGIAYQAGLLSTPFHRVYFNDNSKRVENLPDKRVKFPLGVQLNTFLGSRIIVRTYYRIYWDNFGIASHTFNVEAPVKLGYALSVTPFIRLYKQSEATYFHPYAEHDVMQEFYTSDYDLSNFTSYKTGLGLHFTPVSKGDNYRLWEIEIRYAYYKRSDGMVAHTVTTFFNLNYEKMVTRRFKRPPK